MMANYNMWICQLSLGKEEALPDNHLIRKDRLIASMSPLFFVEKALHETAFLYHLEKVNAISCFFSKPKICQNCISLLLHFWEYNNLQCPGCCLMLFRTFRLLYILLFIRKFSVSSILISLNYMWIITEILENYCRVANKPLSRLLYWFII